MSTSIRSAYTRFASATRLDSDAPVSVNTSLYGVVDSLMHLRDEAGQVLAKWIAPTTSLRWSLQPGSADYYEFVDSVGPFPLVLGPDGSPYKIVLRIAGSIDDASETATFKYVFMSPEARPSHGLGLTSSTTAFASATDAWGTGKVCTLDRAQIDSLMTGWQTHDTEPDGNILEARVALCRLDIWVKCTNVGGGAVPTARLAGYSLREYVGL